MSSPNDTSKLIDTLKTCTVETETEDTKDGKLNITTFRDQNNEIQAIHFVSDMSWNWN